MSKDIRDVIYGIFLAIAVVIVFIYLALFCTGCMYKKFDFDKFWSDSSTRIETQGLVTPQAERSHTHGVSISPGPLYSVPSGLGDGSYTTLE